MKKTLVSALTTALVVGAASTTFAAANPFSDVPEDHWAYDAITQLAADGVIEGYGDTTFRGDRNITRYEMAQMVARAMANSGLSAADKALIDRLAAEFADELNNLGVRVANLEKHADKVKWTGKVEYTYTSVRHDGYRNVNKDNLLFRLEPTAEVNDHWNVHARLDAAYDMAKDGNGATDVTLKRVWAQGNYGSMTYKFGKMPILSQEANGKVGAIVFDDTFSGASVSYHKDAFKATLFAGRMDMTTFDDNWSVVGDDVYVDRNGAEDKTSSIQGLELQYDNGKFLGGAAYYHLKNSAFGMLGQRDGLDRNHYDKSGREDNANIWALNAGYRFDKNSALYAAYARNGKADNLGTSWQVEFDYKGAKPEDKGSWGAWVGYRRMGDFVDFGKATHDDAVVGTKGWTIGANYTLMKNIVLTARYFNGKDIDFGRDNDKVQKLFGRVEFFF